MSSTGVEPIKEMRYRAAKLLVVVGIGATVLAASTGSTGRSERGYDLRYVSTDHDRGGALVTAGGPY
ncbi:hypothetical protein HAPAU_22830 [Halalkalicoccus paucihalophilus]|uniref:Uncharacterized protein n=2 Tax=Halalkalicoccus paucihalophilus TaxID=1008153 RepID=A0A151AD65_9EURY|nr:hypothetical protein HAPAU_22830 [Halalkalicoccus paucihalophilus]